MILSQLKFGVWYLKFENAPCNVTTTPLSFPIGTRSITSANGYNPMTATTESGPLYTPDSIFVHLRRDVLCHVRFSLISVFGHERPWPSLTTGYQFLDDGDLLLQ